MEVISLFQYALLVNYLKEFTLTLVWKLKRAQKMDRPCCGCLERQASPQEVELHIAESS